MTESGPTDDYDPLSGRSDAKRDTWDNWGDDDQPPTWEPEEFPPGDADADMTSAAWAPSEAAGLRGAGVNTRWRGRGKRQTLITGVAAGMVILCVGIVAGGALLLTALNPPRQTRLATSANDATSVATVAYRAPKVIRSTATPPTPTTAPTTTTYVAPTPPPGPAPYGGVPGIGGQLILVSLGQQWLWAYYNGVLLYDTPVTTGMPQLATPDGIFHVQFKEYDVTFYSPWPPGSPYYYSPEHIDYAMYFADYGYYVHDAPWRHAFGPGTNYPHTDPDGTQETGSHGCVNVPYGAGAWLYNWAYNGATVDIYGTAPTGPAATATPQPTAPATATPTQPTQPTPTTTPDPTPTDTPTPTATATP